jgi:hypothetical protein
MELHDQATAAGKSVALIVRSALTTLRLRPTRLYSPFVDSGRACRERARPQWALTALSVEQPGSMILERDPDVDHDLTASHRPHQHRQSRRVFDPGDPVIRLMETAVAITDDALAICAGHHLETFPDTLQ